MFGKGMPLARQITGDILTPIDVPRGTFPDADRAADILTLIDVPRGTYLDPAPRSTSF